MIKLFLFLVLSINSVCAEVLSSANNGFSIVIKKNVDASAVDSYNQFLKVSQWWDKDHTWFGDSANLSIDAHAGGCFCEKQELKQVHHMLVTYVNPGHEIRMTGGLGPLQMMGLHGGMSWKFEDTESGTGIITLTYNVSGYSAQGLESLAEIVNKVLDLQLSKLANKLSPSNNQTSQSG